MKRVRLTPLAEEEAADAAGWYEQRVEGLGHRFLDALDQAIDRITDRPEAGSLFVEQPSIDPIRRVLLDGFPYAVCYQVLSTSIQVLAVAHTSRLPGYWIARARRRHT